MLWDLDAGYIVVLGFVALIFGLIVSVGISDVIVLIKDYLEERRDA